MASLLMRDTYFFNVAKSSNLCCMTIRNLFSIHLSVTLVDITETKLCNFSSVINFKFVQSLFFVGMGRALPEDQSIFFR
jgi:hypothetical protein